MKKLTNIIKEYLPDIIIIVGVWMFSYNVLRPSEIIGGLDLDLDLFEGYTDHYTEWKVLGIVLIAIGIDIAIRRYISYKNKQKNN